MEKVISHILNAGSQYELPVYVKSRVRPTNLICLLVVFALSIPFVVISLIFFPRMAVFPAAGGVVAAAVIGINYLGGIYYSRLVLPILLLVLSSLYNAYFSTSISDSLSGIYLIELSFTLIPFVIFDFSEKAFLVVCTIFSFLILVLFPYTWEHFDMGYDGSVLREGPLAVLTVVLALLFQLSCITGLSFINRQAENRTQLLLDEMNEKNLQIDLSRKQLEGNLAQLEKARVQESNRQWVVEGIAKLADLTRSQSDDEQLYDKVLSTLIKYLQVNQGGLYLVNRDNGQVSISLRACYAYNRKKHRQQAFAPGEGLLGQTYLEGEYIYLTDLPKDYINITSGLGEATPTALLIAPLKVNDNIEGLLEIASFRQLLPHEIEFVLQSGESLAAFIRNSRLSEQTNSLLQQAQQQAEALRAQEEEMRQNLEELEATQEEMRRKNEASEQVVARYQERDEQLNARQEVMRQQLEELEAIRQELERRQIMHEKELSERDQRITQLEMQGRA